MLWLCQGQSSKVKPDLEACQLACQPFEYAPLAVQLVEQYLTPPHQDECNINAKDI